MNDYIATAFHRNTMTNDEGGTDNEEFRTAAVLDRVNTTWQAIMGTTFGCVQCHSHPYDPLSMMSIISSWHFSIIPEMKILKLIILCCVSYNDTYATAINKSCELAETKCFDTKSSKKHIQFLKTWQPAYNSLDLR